VKALVTGAAGFLGRHVVSALLGRGVEVRALVRPATRVEPLGWPSSVEVVRADLRTARDLDRAFDGVEVLVHLAAAVSGGEDAQFAATVVGTERLLEAMARTSCRRVVLASSFSVYDWSAIQGTLDEDSPIEPVPDLYERDGYSIAKSWQERVVRRVCAATAGSSPCCARASSGAGTTRISRRWGCRSPGSTWSSVPSPTCR
jgi:UDP-glucose 4-epimerase